MILFSLSSIVALDSWGTGKQDANFTINQICNDASYITFSTIQYPDKSVQTINTNMTFVSGGSFQYNFSNTSQLGRYDVCGISDGCENTFCSYFEINMPGVELTEAKAKVYVALLVIVVLLFVFCLWLYFRVGGKYTKDDSGKLLDINKLRYLKLPLFGLVWGLLLSIFFISSNLAFAYLGTTLFGKFFLALFTIMMKLYLPLIILLFVWMIAQIVDDKKIKNMISRGVNLNDT